MEFESSYGLRYVPPLHPLSNFKLRRTAKSNARKFAVGQRDTRTIIDELDQYTPDDCSLLVDRGFYCVSYTLLAFLADLNLSIVSLTRTRAPSERHLLLRVICLHVYEASALGRAFNTRAREVIRLRSGDQSLLEHAGEIGRQLNRFAERNRTYLKPIRTHSIAHREDYQKFIAAAETIEETEVLRLAAEFAEITTELPETITACTQLSYGHFQSRWLDLAVARTNRLRQSSAPTE